MAPHAEPHVHPIVTIAIRCVAVFALIGALACAEGPDSQVDATVSESVQGSESEVVMSQADHDRQVDYIEFQATDIEQTKSFYSAVFGWQFTDYGPDYTSFTDGRLAGGFTKAEQVAAGGSLVVMYATDLEAIEARIRENGGEIVRPTFEFPGGRRFHFTDPSGNELAVWSDR